MRLYKRTRDDKLNAVNRCFFDANHGRISRALERIADLHEEFPNDPEIVYPEGLLVKDFLGQGIRARELFERAFTLDAKHAFAAFNATRFARDEREFLRWGELAKCVAPNDPDIVKLMDGVESGLEGGSYAEVLNDNALVLWEHKMYGQSAGLAEIALRTGTLRQEAEVGLRRLRAQSLRALDAEEDHHRETLMEAYAPEERLALHAALDEMDRAIALDEFDAELWNLKAAWLNLLGQYTESMPCVEKAIALRPANYAKPWINKGGALWGLGRDDEARLCVREALRQAEALKSDADLGQAAEMLQEFSRVRQRPTLENLVPLIGHIVNAVSITADQEVGQWKGSIRTFADGVLRRARLCGPGWSMGYLRIMAELLSDVTPEAASVIVGNVAEQSPETHGHCLHAALYVAVHSEAIRRRDAARFLALTILGALTAPAIRRCYREAILEPSAAAHDAFADLDSIVRDEIRRINSCFPELIADQEPVDDRGRARAVRNILSKFSGNPSDDFAVRGDELRRRLGQGVLDGPGSRTSHDDDLFWSDAFPSIASEHDREMPWLSGACGRCATTMGNVMFACQNCGYAPARTAVLVGAGSVGAVVATSAWLLVANPLVTILAGIAGNLIGLPLGAAWFLWRLQHREE